MGESTKTHVDGRIDQNARRKGRDSSAGQLHNDTAYGLVDYGTVVSRKPLDSLKANDIAITMSGANIRDLCLQRHLARVTHGLEGKALEAALVGFSETARLPDGTDNPYRGLRRVRLTEKLGQEARIELCDGEGRIYKAYKGDSNHCYEIWRMPDGRVQAQVITTFEAHQTDAVRKPHPAAKRVLRVHKRDMVAVERDGKTTLGYVQKMRASGSLYIAPHVESNADARDRDTSDPFRLIQMSAGPLIRANARRVHVDEMGRLRDPGPPR